jgi:type II secretory pathway pseudopilin PulG
MLNFVFNRKKGVTILESLIALTLLAVVAVGIFGVVLSISRKTNESDVREEANLAIESAIEQLNLYEGAYRYSKKDPDTVPVGDVDPSLPKGLCGADEYPLSKGVHQIRCLLPPVCDKNNSQTTFSYHVRALSPTTITFPGNTYLHDLDISQFNNGFESGQAYSSVRVVDFNIVCGEYSYENR